MWNAEEGVTAGSERQIKGRRRERKEGSGRVAGAGGGQAEQIENEYQVDGKDGEEAR